ncbi:hypothetical protein FQR65_LT11916 [Abscondita terminalis]|nr:hypothetical protein FQR65_LT11916 [Abscondita terminalis]
MELKQQSKYVLPIEVAEKLRCHFCGGYLSCGPLKMLENNLMYVCGLCEIDNGLKYALQPMMEIAMAEFLFPCKFNKEGCLEQIRFNCTQEHEEGCKYRSISCPALDCASNITRSRLYEHFQIYHPSCVRKDDAIELNLLKTERCNLLLNADDCMVFVKYSYESDTRHLRLSVHPVFKERVEMYELKITNAIDSNYFVNSPEKLCQSQLFSNEECDDYNLDEYVPHLNGPLFVILQIYLGYTAHASIGDESPEIGIQSTCVTCGEAVIFCSHESRGSDIPCLWRGCKEYGTKKKMIRHDKVCKFKMFNCPFEETLPKLFKWGDPIVNHLKTHAEYFTDPEKICIPFYNKGSNKSLIKRYFTFVDNYIVRLEFTKPNLDKRKCTWILECSSPTEITVDMYFIHEHCRLTQRISQDGKLITFTHDKLKLSPCFEKYPPSTALLKIKGIQPPRIQ